MNKYTTLVLGSILLVGCGSTKNIVEETVEVPYDITSTVSEIQTPTRAKYNPSETIKTDIVHTKLEVNFNWDKSQLNGRAFITCKPYFYATDSLILDAKSMEIKSVKLQDKDLTFSYIDDAFLNIKLDKEYSRTESYTVVIDYVAKPEKKEEGGSSAITSDKGLYFINPTGEDKNKMPQIWTQGETEASSVWFPTIDAPNQKMTQEIFITVKDKFTTLSNGKLISSKKNENGTRTDHWKQELPHVPYLAMMSVGEFKMVQDSWTRKDGSKIEVNYYVEPEWEENAKAIFGATPEMIGHFSELLGVEYPWDKYSQIVVRDYVSGAMENTSAVIFGDYAYKTDRELLDANDQSTIAHELFHHWFGDLVTCESWANLPLNESFANYSQYLWDEYKYGVDEADYNAINETNGYMASAQQGGHHNLINYEFENKEDMFDGHSYNKGGRILHMLRNFLGDEAFFAGIKKYLTDNQYEPVEVHHLRLAFEKVSGEDLNWFFNQWFFDDHHPKLSVNQTAALNEVTLTVTQKQNFDNTPIYKLPLIVDIYTSTGKVSHSVEVNKAQQEIKLPFTGELKNVVFDAQRMLLGEVSVNKPDEQFLYQFYNSKRYKDRLDGLKYGSKVKTEEPGKVIYDALNDPFWGIRIEALNKATKLKRLMEKEFQTKLHDLAKNDPKSIVRAKAIKVLSDFYLDDTAKAIFSDKVKNDLSYNVVGTTLLAIGEYDSETAMIEAKKLEGEKSSSMTAQVAAIYGKYGSAENLEYILNAVNTGKVGAFDAISSMSSFTALLSKQDAATIDKYYPIIAQQAIDGPGYTSFTAPMNLNSLSRALETRMSQNEDKYHEEMDQKNVAVANQIKKIIDADRIVSDKIKRELKKM